MVNNGSVREPLGKPAPTDPAASRDGEADRRPPGFSIAEATGGPLGLAEATLPFIVFTIAWTASDNDVGFGALVAVGVSALLAAARLIKGESVQYALSGLIGVGLGAFVADRTGDASNFFLPGILINAASVTAYLLSIAFRRPLIGFFVSQLTGEGKVWYLDPVRRAIYTRASWIWVGLFSFRLSIQLPLYLTDSVAPLATARVITGLPCFVLALWLTYLVVKPILPESVRLDTRRS